MIWRVVHGVLAVIGLAVSTFNLLHKRGHAEPVDWAVFVMALALFI